MGMVNHSIPSEVIQVITIWGLIHHPIHQLLKQMKIGKILAMLNILVGTWDDEQVLKVDFDVDTLIMSGVLIYCQPCHEEFYAESVIHTDLFDRLVNYYKPKKSYHKKRYKNKHIYTKKIPHETIDLSYYKKFDHDWYEFDLDMWLGHRVVMDVRV